MFVNNNIIFDQEISPFTRFILNVSLKYHYNKENNIRLIVIFFWITNILLFTFYFVLIFPFHLYFFFLFLLTENFNLYFYSVSYFSTTNLRSINFVFMFLVGMKTYYGILYF